MHGYRAFRDVLDHAIVERDGVVAVQLFEDVDFGGAKAGLRVRRVPFGLTCEVASGFEGALAVREPSWAESPSLAWNGKPRAARRDAGFLRLEGRFAAGDRIEARLAPRLRLITARGEEMALAALGADPVRAALYCGPWLVVADEQIDPVFFGEPWPGNVVTLPRDLAPRATAEGRVRLAVTYEHDAFRRPLPGPAELLRARRPLIVRDRQSRHHEEGAGHESYPASGDRPPVDRCPGRDGRGGGHSSHRMVGGR
jgi:hypothetical protein